MKNNNELNRITISYKVKYLIQYINLCINIKLSTLNYRVKCEIDVNKQTKKTIYRFEERI